MSPHNPPPVHLDMLLYVLQNTLLSPFFACGALLFAHHAQKYSIQAAAELPFVMAYFGLCWLWWFLQWSSRTWENATWQYGWRGLCGLHRVDWSNEIVLVTGGCRGVGKAVVDILDMKKVTVVVLDRDDPDLAVTTGYNDVCFYKCDIADKAEIRHVAKRVRNEIGSPTMLINNAGIVAGRSLLELSEDEIERTFNVNVLAAFWLIKAFLPKMVEKKHGHIVNVSSLAGNIGCAGLTDYCASKFALVGLHDALRGELRNASASRVRLTLIQPAHIRTGLFQTLRPLNAFSRFLIPLLEPHDVAKAIVAQLDREEGATVCLPRIIGITWLYRGMPSWMQDIAKHFTGADLAMQGFRDNAGHIDRIPGHDKGRD